MQLIVDHFLSPFPPLPSPPVVAIEPEIQTVDISSYHIGSQVTIGCPVQTCASQVRVQFLKGETAIGTPITVMEEDTSSSYNLVLDVTDDIRATYACKVDTMNPDDSVIMEFQVTGMCVCVCARFV